MRLPYLMPLIAWLGFWAYFGVPAGIGWLEPLNLLPCLWLIVCLLALNIKAMIRLRRGWRR